MLDKPHMKKQNPKRIQHFIVYDRIFSQQVDVFLNYSAEQYEKWLNKNKIKDVSTKTFTDDNFSGWTSDYTDDNGKIKRILFIPHFDWTIKHQGTLIHEIVHVIVRIWSANNIPYNADTQEFLAHSIGNLYEDIAHKIFRPRK